MTEPLSFEALGVDARLVAALGADGLTTPTPVQAALLPVLFAGTDAIARADTGSGKTIAFGLPLLQRVDLTVRRPQAVVLVPTRELAQQVVESLRRAGKRLAGLRIVAAVGGHPLVPQARALEAGAHVVVGTPGRMVELGMRAFLDPTDVRCVVLDEADRMLDLGFQEDVERILGAMPAERQTVCLSATMPKGVRFLAERWLREPVQVEVEATSAAPPIRAYAVALGAADAGARADLLARVLAHARPSQALVFVNTKEGARVLAGDLQSRGVHAASLHGDLLTPEREGVLAGFRNGSVRVLVATDVAARGLDLAGLDLVVHAELSPQAEVHVHRSGRTGRAGRPGVAVSFVRADRVDRFLAERGPAELVEVEALPVLADPDRVTAATRTIRILGGRRDKLRPGDILGALTKDGGLPGDAIGAIDVQDRVTYVGVRADLADEAFRALAGGRVKARRFGVERV